MLKIGQCKDDDLRFQVEWMNISSFKKETGYMPKFTIVEAVQRKVEWLRKD